MATIIIPAHNEAALVTETLRALLAEKGVDDEIIVVCNGCTDRTEEICRRFEPAVRVLSTPVASKAHALNLGDQHAVAFSRIYVDADVVLKRGALQKLKGALESGEYLAVAPVPVMDFSASSWAVRAYYKIWLSLPYCRQGMMGAGVYALSEKGRRRFGVFPDLIADDGFVRALFREHERRNVSGAFARVRAPARLRWLLRIKTRSRLGQMQLAMQCPELVSNEEKAYASGIGEVLLNPLRWPAAAVYFYVALASRFLAKRRLADLSHYRWEKDESSRRSVSAEEVS